VTALRRPARFWVTFAAVSLGFGGAVDLWAARNDVPGDTASEQVRALGLPDELLAGLLAAAAAAAYVHLKRREPAR
jgi:hypothetical protein